MDGSTMRKLNLRNRLVHSQGCVFGVCSTPVKVSGYVDVYIRVANEKEKLIRIQVLEGEDQALLLGRQFMHEFGRVDFDWRAGVVRLVKAKLPITAKVIGGNAQERAKTVKQITDGEGLSSTGARVLRRDTT